MEPLEGSEILGTADVARELEVTPDWIRQLVRSGRLRALKTRGGQNLFLADEVLRLKAARQQPIAQGPAHEGLS
jgi:excisionase family DNA binding protein